MSSSDPAVSGPPPQVPGVHLDRVVGRGASSTVYLGTQERFGRKVAVKVLSAADAPPAEGPDPFAVECQVLGRLAPHPDIVTVLDGDRLPDGRAYLVLDFLPGGTLSDRLARDGVFGAAEVARVGVRIAGALETAHRSEVLHGDLKPQNILWSRTGGPALADFGVARLVSGSPGGAASMTPAHAAPEVRDGRPPSVASDVYGLASTLFELATGAPPRRHDDGTVDLAPLEAVDADLAAVVGAALAADPADRPQGAAAFGASLSAWEVAAGREPTEMVVLDADEDAVPLPLAADSTATVPPPRLVDPPEPSEPPRRPTGLLLGAVAAAMAVAVAAGVLVSRTGGDEPAASPTTTAAVSTTVKVRTTGPSASAPEPANQRAAGLQPEVDYEVPGVTPTDRVIAAALADPAIYTAVDPAPLVFDYPQDVQRYPAKVGYQFYNSLSSSTCPGFFAPDTVLRGGLIKGVKWGAGQADLGVVVVQQFVDVDAARVAAAGLALSLGPEGEACGALPPDSQAEVVAADLGPGFGVDVRAPALSGVDDRVDDYSSMTGANEDPRWVFGAKVVARVGTYVVGLATNTVAGTGQVDPAVLSALLNNVVTRLPAD